MKIKKKIIALTLAITMLVSTSLIVNAKILEEENLFEFGVPKSNLISNNEAHGNIYWTEPEPIVDDNSENSSDHNGDDDQNDTWMPEPHCNESEQAVNVSDPGLPINDTDMHLDDNQTDPNYGNESYYGPVLELFTMQKKGFNSSEIWVKETRWLGDTALMVNVGVWVNCGLKLVGGSISLDNLTLNLNYKIKGNESDMLRCNHYFDLYYIISNIEQSDFTNIELVTILNIR